MSNFERDSKWLETKYDELKGYLENEWVAIFHEELMDHDKNLDRLMGRLEARYPDTFRDMVIEFITKKKMEMIL